MCQKSTDNCTWAASFSWRVKLRFGSNRTAPKIWQEEQHDLHSPPQPIDWREHTIGVVHDRNLPTRSLQVPESYENFLWHLVNRQGSKHRDWTASRWWARWRSQSSSCQHMSSLDAGWFRLITNILIQSRDLAMIARWHQECIRTLSGTSVAPWRHKCSHVPVFRRLFDRLPVRISTSDLHHRILRKKLYHIRAYDFGVQFSFKDAFVLLTFQFQVYSALGKWTTPSSRLAITPLAAWNRKFVSAPSLSQPSTRATDTLPTTLCLFSQSAIPEEAKATDSSCSTDNETHHLFLL